ncbi:MAG: AAA family ATPase [Thermodesulfobacteriota bacterium]
MPAEIFVFFGMIATGKSTLAEGFARSRNIAGFNSDRVRKELAGLTPQTRRPDGVGQGIYAADFSRRTYDALLDAAAREIAADRAVVLDASYGARAERDRVRALGRRLGVRVRFVHCVCPEAEMKRRMEERAQDDRAVSDGRWEIYLAQKQSFEPPAEIEAADLVTLSTDAPPAVLQQRLAQQLAT